MADDFDEGPFEGPDEGGPDSIADEGEILGEGEEEISDTELLEADEEFPESLNRIPNNERQSYNKLTKYERTAIISARAEQISRGSKIYIQVPAGMIDPIEIAKLELEARKVPLIIRRMKRKKYEEFKLNELIF